MKRINKSKSWLFYKINKPLVRLIKKTERRHKLPIPEIKESLLFIYEH